MLKYPISTILYLAKLNIKDKIQDALKLHNNINVRLTITIKDKNGKIIKVHKQKSHSFVANFLDILGSLLAATGYNFTAMGGSTFSFKGGAVTIAANATMAVYSIVAGKGTIPPTPNDYNLEETIANGTGSGQLVYNNVSFIAPTVNGNTTSMIISQTFQNLSGASITVTEVGIAALTTDSSGTNRDVLLAHDLLSSPITIPNNGVMAVTYTISVTT